MTKKHRKTHFHCLVVSTWGNVINWLTLYIGKLSIDGEIRVFRQGTISFEKNK